MFYKMYRQFQCYHRLCDLCIMMSMKNPNINILLMVNLRRTGSMFCILSWIRLLYLLFLRMRPGAPLLVHKCTDNMARRKAVSEEDV
jgi:hypothetical protein